MSQQINHIACAKCDKTNSFNIGRYPAGQAIEFDCLHCGETLLFNVEKADDEADRILREEATDEIIHNVKKGQRWTLIAAFAAFLASSFFVVKYFVGGTMDFWFWTWEQWVNALLGLGLTAIITAAQAFLYARGYKGGVAVIATIIFVGFGMFSEVSQSMEREDATVKYRSTESPVFKATLSAINTPTQITDYSYPLLKAEAEKATAIVEIKACDRHKPAGQKRVDQCLRIEEANLAAAEAKITAINNRIQAEQNNAIIQKNALVDKAKDLEYNEENHYAMIRLIQASFGISSIFAALLFSIIIIGSFEYAFHFIGSYLADHRTALKRLGLNERGEADKNTLPEVIRIERNKKTPAPLSPIQPSVNHYSAPNSHTNLADAMSSAFVPTRTPPTSGATALKMDYAPASKPITQTGTILDFAAAQRPKTESATRVETPSSVLDKTSETVSPQGFIRVATAKNTLSQNQIEVKSDHFLAVLKAIDTGVLTRFSYRSVGNILRTQCGITGDSTVDREMTDVIADGMLRDEVIIHNPAFGYKEEGKTNGKSKWLINPDYQKQPARWS